MEAGLAAMTTWADYPSGYLLDPFDSLPPTEVNTINKE